jgi:OFA family oxalate/formate antiporter-like MFS transporter
MKAEAMAPKRGIYYGWILVAVGLVCYGFGISPAYYTWGFIGPELKQDLGLSREQIGSVFGVFQFVFSAVGPLVGIAIGRLGLRATMTTGSICAALGFWMLSRADSVWDCYLAYALIGGVGIGFSTILPNQVLATYWFHKYRARAMAIIFAGGGLVGMGVNPFNEMMRTGVGWRQGWVVIAWISLAVAVIAAILVRDTPARLGLEPDGRSGGAGSDESGEENGPHAGSLPDPQSGWTAAQAIRTPQFAIVTLAGLAYSVPWGVVTAHGGSHLRVDLGLAGMTAALILSPVRVGASTLGRLCGSGADFMTPHRFLACALGVEAVGVGLLATARSEALLISSAVLLGLGFGAAYIAIPIVFAHFFGRQAFATTTGTRIMINGIFGYLGPRFAGRFADITGSYTSTFWTLAVLTLVGAVVAFLCRPPVPPDSG